MDHLHGTMPHYERGNQPCRACSTTALQAHRWQHINCLMAPFSQYLPTTPTCLLSGAVSGPSRARQHGARNGPGSNGSGPDDRLLDLEWPRHGIAAYLLDRKLLCDDYSTQLGLQPIIAHVAARMVAKSFNLEAFRRRLPESRQPLHCRCEHLRASVTLWAGVEYVVRIWAIPDVQEGHQR